MVDISPAWASPSPHHSWARLGLVSPTPPTRADSSTQGFIRLLPHRPPLPPTHPTLAGPPSALLPLGLCCLLPQCQCVLPRPSIGPTRRRAAASGAHGTPARSWACCGPSWGAGGGLVLRGRVQRQVEELPPTPTLLCSSAPTSASSRPPPTLAPSTPEAQTPFPSTRWPPNFQDSVLFLLEHSPGIPGPHLPPDLSREPPRPCHDSGPGGRRGHLAVPSPRVLLASLRSVPAIGVTPV